MADPTRRPAALDALREAGGLSPGVARQVARQTGVPEAHVWGAGTFYHLLAEPDVRVRVCQGLSCRLAGAEAVLVAAVEAGLPAAGCSCLAACDRPVAVLRDRRVLPAVTPDDVSVADWRAVRSSEAPDDQWRGHVGPALDPDKAVFALASPPAWEGAAWATAQALGDAALVDQIAASGLQGRGGAGFPAAVKWRSVRQQADLVRHVVLNADEGEPGTFKDREVLLRRPDLVVEGLAIAAWAVGAADVTCYLRGEFEQPWAALSDAIERLPFPGIRFHLHAGDGAYICGEETALLEALEGKRGMPRLKPPFPTERGLWGHPTLMHNVETIAAVPAIVRNGGAWFRALGRTAPGTKLYCVSGHVARPGTYELPLGVTLDELIDAAGGMVGTLHAFSPGGASSGFLPASERTRPLDFKALAEVGSMLGSAGVVVLNDTVDMAAAVRDQLAFFEAESCGQCAPCRIGTRFQREALDRHRQGIAGALAQVDEVAWQMGEGSICGLGQAASLPLTSALRHFPEDLR
ncbi:MAG: hypothetical protein AMXMBFR64_58750 [Myxococcales bacterium]